MGRASISVVEEDAYPVPNPHLTLRTTAHYSQVVDTRFQPYIEAWIKRLDEQNKEVAKHTEAAQAILPVLVQVLSQDYKAQRITLVGSLARGDFDLESDIDLVVQGVPEDQFFQACAAVNRAAESFWVDVVPYESANSLMRRRQDEEGIVLYAEK